MLFSGSGPESTSSMAFKYFSFSMLGRGSFTSPYFSRRSRARSRYCWNGGGGLID
jgi:hypothetical protein